MQHAIRLPSFLIQKVSGIPNPAAVSTGKPAGLPMFITTITTMNTLIITADLRREAFALNLKPGFYGTHRRAGMFNRQFVPVAAPVTLEEVVDGCLDAPEHIPAGGWVVESSQWFDFTVDTVPREQ